MGAEAAKRAHDYAWAWFQYHASQRLSSFNFFFVLGGALTAGYLAALNGEYYGLAVALAVVLLIVAVLFWRLDQRNSELVKIGEAYLKESEDKLAGEPGVGNKIRLLSIAENRDSDFRPWPLPSILSSYKQIFRLLFFSVAAFSTFAIVYPVWILLCNSKGDI